MTKETKKWWEGTSKDYQEKCKIPIDIHYGPGSSNEKHLKLLGNLKGKKVLEIGCGGAQCGIAMAKKRAKVTGIDISEEMIKIAKNKVKGDVHFLRSNIFDYTLGEEKYDVVIMFYFIIQTIQDSGVGWPTYMNPDADASDYDDAI